MPSAHDAYYQQLDETVLSLEGEDCVYLPLDGEARTVAAAVEESKQQVDEPSGVWLVTTMQVLVSRDATTGIDNPQFGDSLCREADLLADGTPDPSKLVGFSGACEDKGPGGWVLTFTRRAPYELGGNRR